MRAALAQDGGCRTKPSKPANTTSGPDLDGCLFADRPEPSPARRLSVARLSLDEQWATLKRSALRNSMKGEL
jgi:hypothetical protein